MKHLSLLVPFVLAGSLFAMDEYLPVKEKTIEVDVGYGLVNITGYFDDDGKKQDLSNEYSPAMSMIPIQIKYGIIPGLDVEVMVPITMLNEDAGDASGLSQPSVGLKYVVPEVNAGGYVDFALPMGAKEIVGENPTMAITFGGIYGLITEKFNLLATIDYTLEFEDNDKYKSGNTLSIFAKPEYKVMEKLGIFTGIGFDLTGESQFDGAEGDDAGHLMALQPGVNFAATELVAIEAGVPITLLGKNDMSAWGFYANLYFTFGL